MPAEELIGVEDDVFGGTRCVNGVTLLILLDRLCDRDHTVFMSATLRLPPLLRRS